MSKHGVNDYHQSFYLVNGIDTSVNDGDINISSVKFSKLLKFIKEYRLVLDVSEIKEQRDNLKSALSLVNKVLK